METMQGNNPSNSSETPKTEQAIEAGNSKLAEKFALPTKKEAEEIIRNWAYTALRRKASSPAALRAMAQALLMKLDLEIQKLEYVLLGWDIRGNDITDNVNELKDIMDAQQEVLDEVVASQRELMENSKGLNSALQDAIANKDGKDVAMFLSLMRMSLHSVAYTYFRRGDAQDALEEFFRGLDAQTWIRLCDNHNGGQSAVHKALCQFASNYNKKQEEARNAEASSR